MSSRISSKSSYWISVIAEHLLLAMGLFFLVPPPVSMEGQIYSGWYRAIAVMCIFVMMSRAIAMRRGEESWSGALLKLVIFSLLGVALHYASNM